MCGCHYNTFGIVIEYRSSDGARVGYPRTLLCPYSLPPSPGTFPSSQSVSSTARR